MTQLLPSGCQVARFRGVIHVSYHEAAASGVASLLVLHLLVNEGGVGLLIQDQ